MAAQIKIKRSNQVGKAPVVGDLELGELAINTFDGKLFLKKNDGTASIVEVGAGGVGPQGPQGPQGPTGATGATGATTGATPTLDTFSGNGSTTSFTLSVTPASTSAVQVYIGGVYQNSAAFTLSGATLTFAAAPPAGTQNIEIRNATAYIISGASDVDASNITSGIINAARLPSYVDDVLEAANLASFPVTGETGKIYIDLATNKTYRWSGSVYVSFNSGAVDSVAGKTGIVTLTSSDVGLSSVENKNSATIRSEITSANVTTALGFTPLSGIVPIANGGTGTTTPSLAAGTDIAISGTWPNQTISSTVDHLSPFLFLG